MVKNEQIIVKIDRKTAKMQYYAHSGLFQEQNLALRSSPSFLDYILYCILLVLTIQGCKYYEKPEKWRKNDEKCQKTLIMLVQGPGRTLPAQSWTSGLSPLVSAHKMGSETGLTFSSLWKTDLPELYYYSSTAKI